MAEDELRTLYALAKQSLEDQDYEEATALLKKILLLDENYRDASRLLAEIVGRKRRRWYRRPLLWAAIAAAALIGLGIWLVPKMHLKFIKPTALPVTPTGFTLQQGETHLPTNTALPTTTASSLAWKRLYVGQEFPRDFISAMVVDPMDKDVIYVGTLNAGTYRSLNGGLSWSPIQVGLNSAFISTLVIDPDDPATLFAGTDNGVFKTTDRGETWQAVNNGVETDYSNPAVIAIDPQDGQHIFLTYGLRLYETQDGGNTWKRMNQFQCPGPDGFSWFVIHPQNPQILYILAGEDIECKGGLYLSQDAGQTWNLVSENPPINKLFIDLHGENLYARGIAGFFKSTDGGKTWDLIYNRRCHAVAFDPGDENKLYCGRSPAIDVSLDGGLTWKSLYSSDYFDRIGALWLDPDDTDRILAGGQELLISKDGGTSWELITSGLGSGNVPLTVDPFNEKTLYIETTYNLLYRTSDGGLHWELVRGQEEPGIIDSWGLAFGSSAGILMRGTGGGILVSRDDGDTWETKPANIPQLHAIQGNPYKPGILFGFEETTDPPQALFFSSDHGSNWQSKAIRGMTCPNSSNIALYFNRSSESRLYALCDTYLDRSEDGGETWEACDSSYQNILGITSFDSSRLYAITRGNGILTSTDDCRSWQESNTGLGSLFVNTMAIDPNEPATIYAGTDGGAYVSFDGGKSWSQINDGLLGALVVFSIVVDQDGNVYAATPYGIFRLEGR